MNTHKPFIPSVHFMTNLFCDLIEGPLDSVHDCMNLGFSRSSVLIGRYLAHDSVKVADVT